MQDFTIFGTRTICIRAVPKFFCSVNGPEVYNVIEWKNFIEQKTVRSARMQGWKWITVHQI